ncbi:MAG: LamG domain-containing protein [Phycisphaerales bacterium]
MARPDVVLGPESGEAKGDRSLFDDVDDYNGWSVSPPQARDGSKLSEFAAYTRSVKVELTKASDVTAATSKEEGARRVTVTVSRGGARVAQLVSVVALGPVPTQACVLANGSCMDLPTDLCAAIGGTALGAGTTCLMDEPEGDYVAPAPEPIAYWEMDEGTGTAISDSIGGHDGTLYDGTWVTGPTEGALEFTRSGGQNDYVYVPDDAELDLTDQFTIAGVVNFRGGAYYHPMISKGWQYDLNYWVGFTSANELQFVYSNEGAFQEVNSGLYLPLNTWTFVAVTVDGDTVTFYMNGSSAVMTKAHALETNDINLEIARGVDMYEQFEGMIDDVAIYNQVLTDAQLDEINDTYFPPGTVSPVFEGFTEAKGSKDDTTIDLTLPTGTAEGDLLIAALAVDGAADGFVAPAGWNLLYDSDLAPTLMVWWKLAGASEATTHTFTWGSAEKAYGWMMRFTGHDPTTPIGDTAATRSLGIQPSCPSVSVTVPGTVVLRLGSFEDYAITTDSPGLAGHTPITMDSSSKSNGSVSGGAGYIAVGTTGASGTAKFDLTTLKAYRTVSVAIQPAP